MKKLILSAFGIAAMTASTNAQIFSEDFNNGIPATFTLTDVDGVAPNANVGNYTDAWNAVILADDNGIVKDCAGSTSWLNPVGQADDWMSTPAIAIPVTANSIQLEWNSMAADASFPDGLQVYISTTGGTPADFTSAAVYTSAAEPTVWTKHTYDVSTFAGQSIYVGFRNNSTDQFVLAVDDIIVKELFPIDAEMTSVNIAPYVSGGNVNIEGVITNVGSSAITSMDVVWDDGSGPQTDNLTGLNIAAGGTYIFTHATPLASVAGTSYALNISVVLAGDGNTADNALTANTVALTSIPAKTVVGEEKTGTWCPWCPRGTVGMAFMEAEADFIGIAVHNADPMTIAAYDGSIGTYVPGGYPGGGVDRVIDTDPGAAAFLSVHNARKTAIVPCGVKSIDARFDDATGMVSVSAVAEFFGNITGNFRLSCVIVQDDLESTDNGWAQANNYAGGGNGAMAMPNGGYDFGGATSPSSVVASAFGGYDHVARSLSNNDILGDAGSLPTGTVTTGTHNHTFADVNISSMPGVNSAPFVREDAHAVVMIIDVNTGEILNASKANINAPVSVEDVNASEFNLQVFPNPTNDIATISFNLTETASVSLEVLNSVGSVVYAENATTMNAGTRKITFNGTELPNGIYFANIKVGEQIITKKISLIK